MKDGKFTHDVTGEELLSHRVHAGEWLTPTILISGVFKDEGV